MGPYDPLFDRDHDGKLDFFEEYEEQDFYDRMEKRGLYETICNDLHFVDSWIYLYTTDRKKPSGNRDYRIQKEVIK